jgi:hypothetical protein
MEPTMRNLDHRKSPFNGDDWTSSDGLASENLPLSGRIDPGLKILTVPSASRAPHASPSHTAAVATTSSLPSVPPSPTPFTINVTWDASVASAPSGFTSDILAAIQFLESRFIDPVTINIAVGYGEVGGSALAGNALGESMSSLASMSLATLDGAVKADASTATDATAAASLPATSPFGAATFWTTTAEAKALGLIAANSSALDGDIGFGTSSVFTYGDTNSSGTVASGTYDFFSTALHEITEVMGRLMLTGQTLGGAANSYALMDLLHYSAPGTRDSSASTPGYFSPDGGTSNLGAFNTNSGGDAGDWASSVPNDSFDAFATPGVVEPVSANDLTLLDALGWNPAGAVTVSTPTGVSSSMITASLVAAQGSDWLNAYAPLATFAQTGGLVGDTYTYTLGGPGGGYFSLSTVNNVATLAVAPWNLLGPMLYPVTITATDTTTGKSSPAVPVNVGVGTSGDEAVNLATVGGLTASAPSFLYGLGGNDTVNATGLTGKIWLAGGAGADIMTGGSGANAYEYSATSDSTVSAMDIITNFHSAIDVIDLTGLGTILRTPVGLSSSSTTLAADTIGAQQTGGNTYIYVNTSGQTEALSATDMKIELQGNIGLTTSNILHL